MAWDFGVSKELELVESRIREVISSDEPLLTEIATYVVGSGGKRIRPTVSLLAYKSLGGKDPDVMVELSVAYELIHNATLIHDDINDGSSLRRGKVPAHKKWDVHRALVTGDFLFVKGFGIGGRFDSTVVDITANACSRLAEGEIMQKSHKLDFGLSKDDYYKTIDKKTAKFIEAGAMVGAYLADGNIDEIKAMGDYGFNLGMAFQIIDDIMDIVGNGSKMGKEIGTDVREGSLTIPVIYALQELKGDELERLKELYRKEEKTKDDIEEALVLIRSTKAIEQSRNDAKQFADRAREALNSLKRNACRKEMEGLIEYILTRDH